MSVVDIRPPKTSTEYCGGAGAAAIMGTPTVGGGSGSMRPGRSAVWPGIVPRAHAISAPRLLSPRSTPPSIATRVLDECATIMRRMIPTVSEEAQSALCRFFPTVAGRTLPRAAGAQSHFFHLKYQIGPIAAAI